MHLRITAGAFLVCGSKVLLMKRGLHKELGPGLWAGLGGHLDFNDIDDPRAINLIEICYREVREEAGIVKSDIRNLKLRYIAIRKDGDEVRLHHHYIGEIDNEIILPKCDEGELFWIDMHDINGLPMSASVKVAINHWVNNPNNNGVYLVAVNPAGDSAVISEI